MENALIALVSMIIFTVVVYVSAWIEGTYVGRRITKWYFLVMLIATIIVTIVTFILSMTS